MELTLLTCARRGFWRPLVKITLNWSSWFFGGLLLAAAAVDRRESAAIRRGAVMNEVIGSKGLANRRLICYVDSSESAAQPRRQHRRPARLVEVREFVSDRTQPPPGGGVQRPLWQEDTLTDKLAALVPKLCHFGVRRYFPVAQPGAVIVTPLPQMEDGAPATSCSLIIRPTTSDHAASIAISSTCRSCGQRQ